MPDMPIRDDHDLLIEIAVGQREMQSDVRAMHDSIRELKAALDATNERQRDQDVRLVNLTNTVMRVQDACRTEADAVSERVKDARRDIDALLKDTTRWKLYMKIALIFSSPIYVFLMALLIEYGKKLLIP